MNKKLPIVVLVFTMVFLFNLTLGFGSTKINNLTLEKEGEFIKVIVYGDKPFTLQHSTEIAKEGKPPRVILDCLDAEFSLPEHTFAKLPVKFIIGIRSSQYQATPEKIVRIVFDVKSSATYKVVENGENGKAVIAILSPQETDFPIWSAKGTEETTLAKVEQKPKQKEAQEEKPKKVESKELVSSAEVNKVKSESKVAKEQPQPKPAVVSAPVEKPAEKPKPEAQKEVLVKNKPEEKKVDAKPAVEKKEQTSSPAKPKEKVAEAQKETEPQVEKLEVPRTEALSGEVLDTLPVRKMVHFTSGSKDPFGPLTERVSVEFGQAPLPTIEDLKLVGVLADVDGYRALLENSQGYGYIMKSGDRIKNGSVLSVEKTRVIFQIKEYGWTKNVSLELFKEKTK